MTRGKLSEIQRAVGADAIALRGNLITVSVERRGFLHDGGRSAQTLCARVVRAYPEAVVSASGDDELAWWVRFTLAGVHDSRYQAKEER